MRGIVLPVLLFASVLLGGCSIYPLPEDVMNFDSNRIAALIRCQTRDAIRDIIVKLVASAGDGVVYKGMTGSQAAAWLQEDDGKNFREFNYDKIVHTNIRENLQFYKDVSVSYDFTIDTTEMNTLGVNVTLLKQLRSGTDNIGMVAKNDRTREVKRHFRVFDTFDTLARKMHPRACITMPKEINVVFPSAGLLRIDALVQSFLIANTWENLVAEGTNYTTAEMSDTLTFTTKFTGNIDPSTTANPVTGQWVPSSASLNVDNSRQDLHTIIILLRLPPSTAGLPEFDEYGRIIAPGYAGRRAAAAAALDRQRDFNTQDALTRLGTGVGRIGN